MKQFNVPNVDYTIKPLNSETWQDFEKLAEKHNGVWGGCWCTAFHVKSPDKERSPETSRAYKKKLVEEGNTNAALVFDGETCIAWCQFGSPEELPRIYHKKEVESKMDTPDWRITCFFVDRDYRGQGISYIALRGALELIEAQGGGIVESYPQADLEKKVSNSFLYNSTLQVFEKENFTYESKKGKNHCIVRKKI